MEELIEKRQNLNFSIKSEPVFKFFKNKFCVYCKEKANLICILPNCIEEKLNFFCISCLMRNETCKKHHFSNHDNEIFDFFNENILNSIVTKEKELQQIVKEIDQKYQESHDNVNIAWSHVEKELLKVFEMFLENLKRNFVKLFNTSKGNLMSMELKKTDEMFFSLKQDLERHIHDITSLSFDIGEGDFYNLSKNIYEQREILRTHFEEILKTKVKIKFIIFFKIIQNEKEIQSLNLMQKSFIHGYSVLDFELKKLLNVSHLVDKGIHIKKLFPLRFIWEPVYFEDYVHKTTNDILESIKMKVKNDDFIFVGAFHKDDKHLEKPYIYAIDTIGSVFKKTTDKTKAFKSEKTHDLYWYNFPGKSFGFSKIEKINLNSADTENDEGEHRLSWHLDGSGGYRIGNLGPTQTVEFKKAIFILKNYSFLDK